MRGAAALVGARRPGSGTLPVIGSTSCGLVPQVTCGAISRGVEHDLACRSRAPGSDGSVRQKATACSHAAPLGAMRPALQIGEGRLVGRDQAGARAGLDRHVADRHAAFHRQVADRAAGIFDDMAGAAGGADLADDREDQVLGGDAERQLAVDA